MLAGAIMPSTATESTVRLYGCKGIKASSRRVPRRNLVSRAKGRRILVLGQIDVDPWHAHQISEVAPLPSIA